LVSPRSLSGSDNKKQENHGGLCGTLYNINADQYRNVLWPIADFPYPNARDFAENEFYFLEQPLLTLFAAHNAATIHCNEYYSIASFPRIFFFQT
jgi:hypothetical protein